MLRNIRKMKLKKPSSIFYYITCTHGLRFYPNDSKLRVTLRFLIIFIDSIFALYIFQIAFMRHNDQPVLTRVDSSFQVSRVVFPAVAVCNENIISLKETVFVKNILKHHGKTDREIDSFLESLQELTYYGPNVVNVQNHSDIMDILKHYHFTTDSIMYLLHQKCEDLIIFCSLGGITKNCNKMFRLLKTRDGYCCIFNSIPISKGPLALTFFKDTDNDSHLKIYDHRSVGVALYGTSQSGWNSGLRILLNIEPSSYPSWSKARSYGAKILLFDPSDYAELSAAYSVLGMGETVGLDVKPIIYSSHENLREATLEQRQCWFADEEKSLFQKEYSFENCETECTMNNFINTCGCLPYKYPKFEANTSYCELSDLICLNNVTARSDPDCECKFECEDENYTNGVSVLPLIPSLFPENIIAKYNMSELAELQVFFADSTCNAYEKFLLAERNNIIIVYGGIFSLCFGFSAMSLLELIYLVAAYILAVVVKTIVWVCDRYT